MLRHTNLLIVFLLSTFITFGQTKTESIVFSQVETRATLGVNKVVRIYWDETGTLWAYSDSGLIAYNGYTTQIYRPQADSNSLLSNSVVNLSASGENEIWFDYLDVNAFTRLNTLTKEFTHFFHDTIGESAIDAVMVKALRDKDGQMWFTTWGNGLIKLDESTTEFTKFNDFPINETDTVDFNYNFKDIIQLKDGRFLIGSFFEYDRHSHPIYFNPNDGTYSFLETSDYFIEESDLTNLRKIIRNSLRITNFIYEDDNKNLWFGTYSGLIFIDQKNKTIERISGSEKKAELQNLENARQFIVNDDELWVGTPNMGIMVVNLKTHEVKYIKADANNNNSLADNRIEHLSKDNSGQTWVATSSGIISVYTSIIQQFKIIPWANMDLDFANRSQQIIPVNQMTVLDSTVLISSSNGLIEIDPFSGIYRKIDLKMRDNYGVKHMKYFGDKMVFINSQKKVHIRSKDHHIRSLDISKKNRGKLNLLFRHDLNVNSLDDIYLFSVRFKNSHLFKMNTENQTFESFLDMNQLELSETFSLILPSKHWIISTVENGFVIVDPDAATFKHFTPNSDHFFPDMVVNCAYLDPKTNTLWIGSSSGLYEFNEETEAYTQINSQVGLRNNESVKTMIRDQDGFIWIATENNLIRWNDENGNYYRFDKSVGMNARTILPSIAQMDKSGRLYFATIHGILTFDPKTTKIPNNPLHIYLDQVSLFNKTLADSLIQLIQAGNYKFHWNDNFISFNFATNQVLNLSPTLFKYRLIGQNSNWIDNGSSNVIRFENLQYGDYTLEVVATNNYGINSETYQLNFSIKRPFWFAPWFYFIIIPILGILVIIYIKQREKKLKQKSEELEKLVEERTSEVVKQKQEAEYQKNIAIEKQKEITDSIAYAKKIQEAILPDEQLINYCLPNSFIFYLPKDIVAGDFYWVEPLNRNYSEFLFAAADCTGHGVPGAMVSVVCNNALNRSVREYELSSPGRILDKTRDLVVEQFNKNSINEQGIKDGMDISLCKVNREELKLEWAGANNPIWIYRQGKLIEVKGDKQPVGQFHINKPFSTHEIALESNDVLYVFSDGYADQFGGEKGKKFKSSSLKKLLKEIGHMPLDTQLHLIRDNFMKWKGENEQIDDVCMIGMRV